MLEVRTGTAPATTRQGWFDVRGEIVARIRRRANFRLFFREGNDAGGIGLMELAHRSLRLHALGLRLAQSAHHTHDALRYRLISKRNSS
ncbi:MULTISPECIES: hypothetical protein [unclassified Bradyrhizobium]|uniref:hypothetical protein n=1 Tax=unclassified Bradyrhizobium TaxID=2631580 RepID=UPI0004145F2F|nr:MULTISPECIES: hypothetical protein [unclassified Bradyrhizobium]QIG93145.1 hypothetical protein G6P99_11975 [Bradyrhizobium sp. 6(2017)]